MCGGRNRRRVQAGCALVTAHQPPSRQSERCLPSPTLAFPCPDCRAGRPGPGADPRPSPNGPGPAGRRQPAKVLRLCEREWAHLEGIRQQIYPIKAAWGALCKGVLQHGLVATCLTWAVFACAQQFSRLCPSALRPFSHLQDQCCKTGKDRCVCAGNSNNFCTWGRVVSRRLHLGWQSCLPCWC